MNPKPKTKKKYPPRIIEIVDWNYFAVVMCCGEKFGIRNCGHEATTCPKCGKKFSMELVDDTGKIVEFKKFGERLR